MREYLNFYINGQWVAPAVPSTIDVVNPASEEVIARISNGSAADVDAAVSAARVAFPSYSRSSVEQRIEMFENRIPVIHLPLGVGFQFIQE